MKLSIYALVSVNYIHWQFLSRMIETTTSEMRKLYYAWKEWESEEEEDDEDEEEESEEERRFDVNFFKRHEYFLFNYFFYNK